jgi:hypothetical protein
MYKIPAVVEFLGLGKHIPGRLAESLTLVNATTPVPLHSLLISGSCTTGHAVCDKSHNSFQQNK